MKIFPAGIHCLRYEHLMCSEVKIAWESFVNPWEDAVKIVNFEMKKMIPWNKRTGGVNWFTVSVWS